MRFETSNKPISFFNFSSLTDIVMLLLIFFLLTSQFVIQTGVKVKLPGSKTNEQTIPAKFIVTITSTGVVYLGKDEVPVDALAAELSIMKKDSMEENLIIRADKDAVIDLVIKVIDAAKSSGFEKFTIETEKQL